MGVHKGYKQTEEHKKNAKKARGKVVWTKESRKKLSISKKKNPTNYWKNKKRPEMKEIDGWYHKGKTWEEIMGKEKAYERRIQLKKRMTSAEGRRVGMCAKITKISKAEIKLKKYFDNKKIKNIPQFKYELGIADFYLPKYNLIVECYGTYWHNREDYIKRDKIKNNWLQSNGYNILILWSEDITESDDLSEFVPFWE